MDETVNLIGHVVNINNVRWRVAQKTFRFGREWQYTLSHENVDGTYETIRIGEDALLNIIQSGSRVIDSKYPNYKQIIPNEFITEVVCEVDKLIPIIKSVSLFCKQGINDINLIFDSKNQKLEVSTTSSINGSKDIAKIPVKITGGNNDIVFNFRYLLDGLKHINNKEVTININDSKSPGLLKPEDEQDYIYLIMPIKQ